MDSDQEPQAERAPLAPTVILVVMGAAALGIIAILNWTWRWFFLLPLFSILTLLPIWICFGQKNFLIRVICWLATISLLFGCLSRTEFLFEYSVTVAVIAFIARQFCWIRQQRGSTSSTTFSRQFSLRELLMFMTAVSLLCGFCAYHRGLLSLEKFIRDKEFGLFIMLAMVIVPSALAVLAPWRAAFIVNCLPPAFGLVAGWFFTGGKGTLYIGGTYLAVAVCCAIPMLVLRAYGYRLHWRLSRAGASPSGEPCGE